MELDRTLIHASSRSTRDALAPLRRSGAFPFLALALVAALAGPAPAGASPAPGSGPRPDLLLVTLDTTRADALGCYGAAGARTPVLDALAAAGTRFASAWSPAPLTLPAHASLFTGLEPAAHGLRDNGWARLDPDALLLAEELKRAGYATAGFVASRVLDARFGLARGFELYDDRMAAERLGQYGEPERAAAAVVDSALHWLGGRSADGGPVFVWVHFYDPHAPYVSPSKGASASERERYADEVADVDRELGRLLRAWPADRTPLVAVVADHGEAFGEHGERGHGLLLYRSTLEVPLILSGPGVENGVVIRAAVGTRRLGSTLLRLLSIPSKLPGPPLPLSASAAESVPIFHETLLPATAYGWSPLAAVTGEAGRAIAAPRPELYELASDPGETTNLISRPSSAQRRLQRALLEHLERHPLAVEAPAPDAETAAALRALGYLSGQSRRAGTRDPKDGVALLAELETARLELARGEPERALSRLESLVARSPESVPFLSRLAAAQRELGRNEAALATLDRALRLAPRLEPLHQSRAEVLFELGRKDAAAEAFRLVLRLAPRAAGAWLKLAEMELRAGRPAGEERLLNEAVAAGTTSAAIAARLGEIALRKGDLAAADHHLSEATSLLPEWGPPWRLWAEVARRQGKTELAAERESRARPR